jgi:NitT/TauT family transport system permease protein
MTPLLNSPRAQVILPPVVVGIAAVVAWQAVCRGFSVPAYLFPAPTDVIAALVAGAPSLLHALVSTMKVTLIAFALSTIVGTLTAFLFVQSRFIERGFFPYAVMLQVTPVVAIAPLIIILVRDTTAALVICATIIAIFPVISNTTVGLRSVDPGLVNLMRVHKATRLQTLLRLRIPSALSYFFAGLRISSGLALIGAVVAEFVAGTGGRSAGLAYEILQAGFQLDIPRMFAALALITIAGILLFLAMSGLTRLALGDWHESERSADRAR